MEVFETIFVPGLPKQHYFILCLSMNYRDFAAKSKLIISLFQRVKLSYSISRDFLKIVLFRVVDSGHHYVKVLSTTVSNSIVAMVTYLWRHLTYNLRASWHTLYTM